MADGVGYREFDRVLPRGKTYPSPLLLDDSFRVPAHVMSCQASMYVTIIVYTRGRLE